MNDASRLKPSRSMFPIELPTFDNADENGVKQNKRPYETSEGSSLLGFSDMLICLSCLSCLFV